MIPDQLTQEQRQTLLTAARKALEQAVCGELLTPPALESVDPKLRELGATFVTLTRKGELRGCIGSLEAFQPLIEDACEHAIAAALQDYRFPPVQPEELAEIEIEISRLTAPTPLEYETPEELVNNLRPNLDGVVLRDGFRRSTFLPQVWEKVPEPALFLDLLCQKMGAPMNLWQRKKLEVFVYQVEEFHE
jgi:AmmeMemoRadiSam system protein A